MVTTEVAEALHGSDLVVLCTPVELLPVLVQRIVEVVGSQQSLVLTDVGSTKSVLVRTIEAQLQTLNSDTLSFVGAHPMAGSHETGVDAALATLLKTHRVF